jgi:hypothetical protein
MVAYLDVDKMYWEMRQLYEQERDMKKVYKTMVDSFKDVFDQNKADVIKEVKDSGV